MLIFRDQTVERKARRALEASEERYRSLVENLDVGIASVDPSETVTFANPAADLIFGVPRGTLAGSNLKEFLDDGEYARLREETAKRSRGEKSIYEIIITRSDEGERRLQVTAVPQFDPEGRFAGTFGTVQDITEKSQAEEALTRQRVLTQALMDNVPDRIYFKDPRGRFILISKSQAQAFGITKPDEAVGKTDFDFFSWEHAKAALEDEQRVLRTGQPIIDLEEKETWPDRPESWVSTTKMPLRNDKGEVIGTFGISRVITEHKRMEDLLRESEEHYRSTFMNAPFGIFHSTADGKIISANHAYASIMGYDSPEELKEAVNRRSVAEVLYENSEKAVAVAEEVLRTAGWQRFLNRYRRKDGTRISAVLTVRPYAHPGTSRAEFEGFVEDITERERAEQERKRLQEQFQQAQKMEAVGRLAGGIAHDFNNILTAIYGYCDIGIAQAVEPKQQHLHGFFLQIRQAAARAANLTSQLLAFSRRRILQPRAVNVGELVADMMDMLKRLLGEDVDVHMHGAAEQWSIRADPGQLEQVLMNLAVNSRDAMPRGGVLTIETANARLDESYVREHAEVEQGEYVALTVSDTGHGMDEATRARIYEPFFTTKEVGKGTGLGLATVYGIVKQSGGYIYCYSEVGKGTTFKVYFPRWEGVEEKAAQDEQGRMTRTSGTETILFVDDDEAVRRIAVSVLQTAGYAVISFGDGSEALKAASALASAPDLLITDVVMPGLGGSELARKLVERFAALGVLYMSGYTENAIVHHGILREGVELLQKPFTAIDLLTRVRNVLDAGRRSGT